MVWKPPGAPTTKVGNSNGFVHTTKRKRPPSPVPQKENDAPGTIARAPVLYGQQPEPPSRPPAASPS